MTDNEPPRGRVRSIVRWIPAVLLAITLGVCWTYLFLGGIQAVAAWVGLISAGQILGPLTVIVVLVHAVRKRRFSRPMVAAFVLALFSLWPALWGFGLFTMTFPSSLDDTGPAATVRLPSDERLRVGWGGDTVETNYHAAYPDQRWAYDLLVEPAMHGSERLEDYGIYGTPVLAPAAGVVRHAEDGHPDETPGITTSRTSPFGNHVVLRMDTNTHLVLAHLKPGSVTVKTGDEVAEGQLLGLCGNSGNTSEPHLHIHHQRENPATRPPNFGRGLPLYFRDHDGAAMPEGGFEVRDEEVVLTGAIVQHVGDS